MKSLLIFLVSLISSCSHSLVVIHETEDESDAAYADSCAVEFVDINRSYAQAVRIHQMYKFDPWKVYGFQFKNACSEELFKEMTEKIERSPYSKFSKKTLFPTYDIPWREKLTRHSVKNGVFKYKIKMIFYTSKEAYSDPCYSYFTIQKINKSFKVTSIYHGW